MQEERRVSDGAQTGHRGAVVENVEEGESKQGTRTTQPLALWRSILLRLLSLGSWQAQVSVHMKHCHVPWCSSMKSCDSEMSSAPLMWNRQRLQGTEATGGGVSCRGGGTGGDEEGRQSGAVRQPRTNLQKIRGQVVHAKGMLKFPRQLAGHCVQMWQLRRRGSWFPCLSNAGGSSNCTRDDGRVSL